MARRRVTKDDLTSWVQARVPAEWFSGRVRVEVDRDELLVTGPLAEPRRSGSDGDRELACLARVVQFREATRERRVALAAEAEALFGRKVSWGASCGDVHRLFTTASVPVMTRLRLSERRVLDTLIDAGVARSRSEALAWCVRLVGAHEADWIEELRRALEHVEEVRGAGPDAGGPGDEPEPA